MNFVPKNDQITEYEKSFDDALRNLGVKSQELEKEKELIEEMKMLPGATTLGGTLASIGLQ